MLTLSSIEDGTNGSNKILEYRKKNVNIPKVSLFLHQAKNTTGKLLLLIIEQE